MFETGSIGGDVTGLRAVPTEALLARLAATPPGLEALPILVALGERTLDADGWLTVTERWAAQDAWQAAQRHAATAAFAGPAARSPGRLSKCHDAAAYEYAPAHRVCVETAAARLFHARQLAGRCRPLRDALAAGLFTDAQIGWLVDRLAGLPDATAAAVQAALIHAARTAGGLPTGVLRRRAGRLIDTADPTAATRRADEARTERRVELGPIDDGMAWLSAWLPAELAAACYAHLDAVAHVMPAGTGETFRSLDARRADALATAILGAGDPASAPKPAVEVQVTIDLPTLLHLRENPGEIPGLGTLPADVARALAADATWRRLVYDPSTATCSTTAAPATPHPPDSPPTSKPATATACSPPPPAAPPTPTSTTPCRSPKAAPPAPPTSPPSPAAPTGRKPSAAG